MANKTLEVQLQEARDFLSKDPENVQLKKNAEGIEAKITAKAEKTKEDKEKTKEEAVKAEEFELKYDTFTSLHHLQYDGNTQRYSKKLLKEDTVKRYEKLEKEIKSLEGKKPKKTATVYAAGLAKNVRFVEGYALPESLYNQIRENDSAIIDLYF